MSLMLLLVCARVLAHPEDEFCMDSAMDPLLCAQLAALDAAEPSKYGELPEIRLDRSPLATAALYIRLGVEHILPMGADHLLFVLAILLSTARLGALLLQISLFTLAHSITLILSVAGVITPAGAWVEVAIALTIAFVGIENIALRKLSAWRPLLVFCFGLLHGLGFAGALRELGIPDGHFFAALVGFNLGVEIAQLGFALVVFLLLWKFMGKAWYRLRLVLPLSVGIALLGLFWAGQRLWA
jgi:hypothetical protein